MLTNFEAGIAFAWRPENDGQPYHVDPHDPGKGTAWCVTEATWAHAVEQGYVQGALRDASQDDLKRVLKVIAWDTIRGDRLAAGPDLLLFDIAIVDGAARAARLLQRVLGITEDGIIGPATLTATAMRGSVDLIVKLASADEAFLAGLDGFKYFGNGWTRRCEAAKKYALDHIPVHITQR